MTTIPDHAVPEDLWENAFLDFTEEFGDKDLSLDALISAAILFGLVRGADWAKKK